jgi:hypothetical protein
MTQDDATEMVHWDFTEIRKKKDENCFGNWRNTFNKPAGFVGQKPTRYFKIVIRYSSGLLNSLYTPTNG